MAEGLKTGNIVANPGPARLAYAAAHVVTKPEMPVGFTGRGTELAQWIDWDRTMAFRRYLWSLGLGVAEAMDTAQRNQIGWDIAAELLDRTLAEARKGDFAWPEVMGGAGTDGLAATDKPTLSAMVDEVVRQANFIQSRGGSVILLATPLMPKHFPRDADYVEFYSQIARQLKPPVFLHWLGEMFLADLKGYFPGNSFYEIMDRNAGVIKGVKLSLLDDAMEIEMRGRLRENSQIVLTGDDYHYTDLIVGDGTTGGSPYLEVHGRKFPTGDFSHALLGIFDAIAPAASRALGLLAGGDAEGCRRMMGATEELARVIFEPPTQFYKAGVVFLAYLNGHQDHFALIGGLERERSHEHYSQVYELAKVAGVLCDANEAERRWKNYR